MDQPQVKNDRRGLALILFHALRKAIEELDPDSTPGDSELRAIIIKALNLLPQLDVESTEDSSWILLRRLSADSESEPVRFNVQDTIDSLRVLWQDYCHFNAPDATMNGQEIAH